MSNVKNNNRHWLKHNNKWLAQIKAEGKNTYLGQFIDEEAAALPFSATCPSRMCSAAARMAVPAPSTLQGAASLPGARPRERMN